MAHGALLVKVLGTQWALFSYGPAIEKAATNITLLCSIHLVNMISNHFSDSIIELRNVDCFILREYSKLL